jgi:arabinan endo-1,5-alpha-L-arabinosidase
MSKPRGPVHLLLVLALAVSTLAAAPGEDRRDTYTNPLNVRTPEGEVVESCADPAVLRGQEPGDTLWYLYCTTDPLNSDDRDANGDLIFHFIPTFTSTDLVNWTYAGDVFDERPEWIGERGPWAPEIAVSFHDGLYYLYYSAPDLPTGGSAIGVATSDSPTGPWTDSGRPVVEPHAPPCCPDELRWVYDPEVITTPEGQRYIYYGSYFGGVAVRELSEDGLSSDPSTQVQVTVGNRYEGTQIIQRDGYYYLLGSATDCCRGPLTGYSVFAGRSTSPTGPFVDRGDVPLLAGRVGGTPVISMNGNRWVGTGHQDTLTDYDGQDWIVYHAADRFDPYFEGEVGFTKRPVLMDALDWVDGWPTVRNGAWASDSPQPAPAAQPGETTRYRPPRVRDDRPGRAIRELSDEFDAETLTARWDWVREPETTTVGVADGVFFLGTQNAELYQDFNTASVLTEPIPRGDYLVETRVRLNLPPEGCCYNFVQAGMVVYGDDDNFVKLVHSSIFETRQTEFAKEVYPVPEGYPRYGNTVVGPPGDWTWLRIAKQDRYGEEHYTAYTSRDGQTWARGGTWTHELGGEARIGLIAMGGQEGTEQFLAEFDYVRVSRLRPGRRPY